LWAWDAAVVGSVVLTLDALGPDDPVLTHGKGSRGSDLFVGGGGGGSYCPGTPCPDNYHYSGWGRLVSKATTVRLQLGPGPVHEVPVTDGWFAFTSLSAVSDDQVGRPKLTAYDKDGKVVKVISQ
jgi:hypothetical protein